VRGEKMSTPYLETLIFNNHHCFEEPYIIIYEDGLIRCGYCESELEKNQKVCGVCGHRLDWRKRI